MTPLKVPTRGVVHSVFALVLIRFAVPVPVFAPLLVRTYCSSSYYTHCSSGQRLYLPLCRHSRRNLPRLVGGPLSSLLSLYRADVSVAASYVLTMTALDAEGVPSGNASILTTASVDQGGWSGSLGALSPAIRKKTACCASITRSGQNLEKQLDGDTLRINGPRLVRPVTWRLCRVAWTVRPVLAPPGLSVLARHWSLGRQRGNLGREV